jgi:predicted flap endonuclease-1-like 5' DNA nuclease
MQDQPKSTSRFARAFGYFSLGLGVTLLVGWWLKQEEQRNRQRSAMPHHHPNPPENEEPIIILSQQTLDAAGPAIEPQKPSDTAPSTSDDLTQIKGIGAKTQAALAALGIHTFNDLARHHPHPLAAQLSHLRGITPEKVGAWIAAAKQR